jgi:thiol-disulfide isomerase/thioredoxin
MMQSEWNRFSILLPVLLLASCAPLGDSGDGSLARTAPSTETESGAVEIRPAQIENTETPEPPGWFDIQLTDVNTGSTFSIEELRGRVILVETMAMWCPNCLQQQKQVKSLHELLGAGEGWVGIALDIDPNEDAEALTSYTARNGFDWLYAIAPPEVQREIGRLYGNQFLNPPSTPILLIDRGGAAHPLPFGIKSAESLRDSIRLYL